MDGCSTSPGAAHIAESDKPLPRDLSHLYSETTKHRLPSAIKQYYRLFLIPGIGQLAGGLPNVRFFPYDTLEAQAARPDRWTPTPNDPSPAADSGLAGDLSGLNLSSAPGDDVSAANHIAVPKASGETDPVKRIDLTSALQYGTAEGYPPLRSWIRQFARQHLHPAVPYRGGPEVILTCGSTDGMSKTLDLFVNPWSAEAGHDLRDRPGLLVEPFMYPSVLSQALPRGVQAVPVVADEGGMCAEGPGGLEDVLGNWDPEKGRRPHLLYTVTMGHNPTGILLSVERRKALYAVCSKYDVVIIEDDPYWYLQFPSAAAEEALSRDEPVPTNDKDTTSNNSGAPSSGYDFLGSLVPSFLRFDTDGRVVRLDTFSKTIAPGCRLGWITAQPDLIERYLRIAETSTQQPSGFVQSMVAELVMGPQDAPVSAPPSTTGAVSAHAAFRALRSQRDRAAFTGWQMDGWVRWVAGLRGAYERRMARMCRILDAGRFQLKQGTPVAAADAEWGVVTKTQLFSYCWPRGGMFVWLRVHFEAHPLWHAPRTPGGDGADTGVVDGTMLCTALFIFLTHKPALVLASPGMTFSATDEIRARAGWRYYRLCFAAEAEDTLDGCTHRFVEGVHRFWKIKKVQELEHLLKDMESAQALDSEDDMGQLGTWLGC